MSKRDTIANLLRKAAASSGATEAEVAAAMALAQKLANAEGLSLDDISKDNVEAHDYIRRDVRSNKKHLHPVDSWLAGAIGKYTCCMAISAHSDADGKRGRYISFFGHAADIELALYIRDICMKAMDNGWWLFVQMEAPANIKAARFTFTKAFAARMSERLNAYTRADAPGTGTSLIVVKNQLLVKRWDEYAKKHNINLHRMRGSSYRGNDAAARAAGDTTARNVDLGRGVRANSRHMIGKA